MQGNRILLIIGGGIAAYKALELIRLIRRAGGDVTPVLTAGGAEFVTPLSVSTLAGEAVHEALFDTGREAEIGHIQLSRRADLVVVAPATADLMAKMVTGQADDMASTLLLATDKPVLAAPAMNVRMWQHPATRRNHEALLADGVRFIGPDDGEMACGEYGPGRMAEPEAIFAAIREALDAPLRISGTTALPQPGPLAGRRALVTSGPTHEPIDPVRYIANRSSGAQGTEVAIALRDLGAEVVFITGPARVPPPEGVEVVRIETADQMRDAVANALPVDVAVMAAAVADWKVLNAADKKMKKDGSGRPPMLEMGENVDILGWLSRLPEGRPKLVVGFAAETHDVVAYATAKRLRKGCDWIVANDVSPASGIMGGSENEVTLITADGAEPWSRTSKAEVSRKLAARIAEALDA